MKFKDNSYLEIWWLVCLAEQNNLCIFVEGIMRNISMKLFEFGPLVQKMLFKDIRTRNPGLQHD